MEKEVSYIARTSGLKAKDYIGYALVDAAGCLVFSLVTSILQDNAYSRTIPSYLL